jgi:HTH-type transcriptional regulator, sugar sensing transcriptional regulator
MHNSIEDKLIQIGLHKSEIEVYLYLLESGLSTPPQVARGTCIARTNTYNLLESLQDKGLIIEHKKGKRKAYLASDPEAILRSIERKKEAIERILPDLRGLYTVQKNKPKIRFYEGFEQVKEIYWQVTNTDKLLAIGSTKMIVEKDPAFFDKFQKELKRKGVFLQDIITNPSEGVGSGVTKDILNGMYDFRLLPEKYKDFSTDLLIWDNNIALITLQDPIFGTVIENPLLAQTFRYIFEMVWEGRQP